MITVITASIPSRAAMLAECMASISEQTLPPDAHLVGVDYARHGSSATRNALARSATTEWVAVLDDDDVALTHHLALLYQAGYEADIVYSLATVEGRDWNPAGPFDAGPAPARVLHPGDGPHPHRPRTEAGLVAQLGGYAQRLGRLGLLPSCAGRRRTFRIRAGGDVALPLPRRQQDQSRGVGRAMRVLITGVAGFIGSHLAERLLAEGHEVFGLDNLSTGSVTNVPFEVEFTEGDVADIDAMYLPPVDVIYHLAASYRDGGAWELDARTNVLGTIAAVRVAMSHGARLVSPDVAVLRPVARQPDHDRRAARPLRLLRREQDGG